MTEKQKHKEEWKIQLEKEKQIEKEFKTIQNKWIKNWFVNKKSSYLENKELKF